MKRIGIFLICMMLVTSCVMVFFPIEIVKASGNTFYVGGSGPGNYTTIQSAIDAASPGDTVFIYEDSSPYIENIIVNKSINILGEYKDTTIIDGNGKNYVICINAENVKINDLSFRNTSKELVTYGSGIKIQYSSNILISDCIVTDAMAGITITDSQNNHVSYCDISDNSVGILLVNSSNNLIDFNTVSDNQGSFGSNMPGTWSISGGIVFSKSSKNILKNNNLSNNFVGLIFIDLTPESNIKKNDFDNNIDSSNTINWYPVYYFFNKTGLTINNLKTTYLTLAFCNNCQITNCNIDSGDSISLISSNNCIISHCNSSNNFIGISITGSNEYSSNNNIIQNCNMSNNFYNGFGISYGTGNIISNCIMRNNGFPSSVYQAPTTSILNNKLYNDGLMGDIDSKIENNTVNDKNLYYFSNKKDIKLDGEPIGQVCFINCSNCSVVNTEISHTGAPIIIALSNNILIHNCKIQDNTYLSIQTVESNNIKIQQCKIQNNFAGIYMQSTSDSEISDCNISNNRFTGIALITYSNNNIIKNCNIDNSSSYKLIFIMPLGNILIGGFSDGNLIYNCSITNSLNYGISVFYSSNNHIYQNKFINNYINAMCTSSGNYWDDNEKGNYWDDYEELYPNASKIWWKGVWDTPYDITGGNNQDKFPLIKPEGKSKNKSITIDNPLLRFLENYPIFYQLLHRVLNL